MFIILSVRLENLSSWCFVGNKKKTSVLEMIPPTNHIYFWLAVFHSFTVRFLIFFPPLSNTLPGALKKCEAPPNGNKLVPSILVSFYQFNSPSMGLSCSPDPTEDQKQPVGGAYVRILVSLIHLSDSFIQLCARWPRWTTRYHGNN